MIDSADVTTLARGAVETAKDVIQDRIDDVTQRGARRRRARRSRQVFFVLLALAGLGALVYFLMQRTNPPEHETEIAPEPFGDAVDEERRRDLFSTSRV